MNNQDREAAIRAVLTGGVTKVITTLCPDEISEIYADNTYRIDRHIHREILFILLGECTFMLGGRVYMATPGTAFFLNEWEPHSNGYRADDRDLIHLWVHFQKDHIYANMVQVGYQGRYSKYGKYININNDLRQLLLRRWHMLENMGSCDAATQKLLLCSPLNSLLEEFILHKYNLIAESNHDSRDIVLFLSNYIKHANGRDCSLGQLEKLSGYSRFYISRLFREKSGMTIGEYINDVRMLFAEEAKSRGMKQKEIASELGFSSPAAFWYWHKRCQDAGKKTAPGRGPDSE